MQSKKSDGVYFHARIRKTPGLVTGRLLCSNALAKQLSEHYVIMEGMLIETHEILNGTIETMRYKSPVTRSVESISVMSLCLLQVSGVLSLIVS